MSWNSKVVWSEGLFLRPHHLQQSDRYLEHLIEARVNQIAPYPWGFTALEIDRDLAQQSRFAVRRATGVMPDGTPFDIPAHNPPPPPIEVPESAAKQLLWITMPGAVANMREVDDTAESASRFVPAAELVIDSTAVLRVEEEIDVAYPRLSFELRKTAKPGFVGLGMARVIEVRDKTIIFDEKYAPPVLTCMAHPVTNGWIERVIGWVDTALAQLARFAADATAGGGLQSSDYFMLMLLNRQIPVLRHLYKSRFVHPERLYVELLKMAGELATYSPGDRRARDYREYDHDDLEGIFEPVLRDLQDFLSMRVQRALRLEITELAPNAFRSLIRDRTLFRDATFVLEVAARRPLTEIQTQFPQLFKVGPDTKMREIVNAHLPGIPLLHHPTPPPQIRAISDHVYFLFDRQTPLWPEFSTAASIGMHFSGDWPGLELELWAIREGRR